ncbi:TIGR03757 family integrating conjugative element protein [Pseudomonas oryzihabitans]|uniref:TIGR03757 family integrating conjugative element protein n=1 Tax=Pseudomonas oryzihabitans TaxID=47885 RepID=UPI0021DA1161|nr:TIGR03757 family integrating conjugative element protein [Pseudomonas oryzihabitans]MDK8263635.1 TIGR03757 family integrating conjugative element protein [Pseudomonas oryzihabitans]
MSALPSCYPAEPALRWLICALAACSAPFAAADVLAISDATHPLTNNIGTHVVLLDAPERLEQKLSEGLPADPRQAAAIMQQRMRSASTQQLGRELAKAHQDVADVWSLGITKLPAVVVDRRYVVYGQPDVAATLASIERYRSSER